MHDASVRGGGAHGARAHTGQEQPDHQNENAADNIGDIGYQLVEALSDHRQAQIVHSRDDDQDEYNPVRERPHQRRWCHRDAPALEKRANASFLRGHIKCNKSEKLAGGLLRGERHDPAEDEYDDREVDFLRDPEKSFAELSDRSYSLQHTPALLCRTRWSVVRLPAEFATGR